MESISGIEIYPIISFLIFFTFFLLLTVWVIKADKKYIKAASMLPVDDVPEADETQKQ